MNSDLGGMLVNLYKENLPDGFYGLGNDFVYAYEASGTGKVPGRLASASYNGAAWSQAYRGADGRLDTVTAAGSGFSAPFAHAYDADSRHLESVSSGSHLQKRAWESWREKLCHAYSYWGVETAANLRAHYEVAGGNGVMGMTTQSQLLSVYLRNDNASSLASKLQSGGGSEIQYVSQYDALGQLKSWSTSRTAGNEAAYDWDAAGNPTSFDGTALTPNGFNQLGQFAYDADGNLTQDSLWRWINPLTFLFEWTYRYDANNRLYRMSGSGKSLQFNYDYMGRRVEKKVWSVVKNVNDDSLWTSAANTHLKFAYQGMELVAELDSSGGLRKSFHWGLDKSNTRGGAGGAMGLLMWRDYTTSQSYYPSYDLNGNVAGLLDSSGTYVAWYDGARQRGDGQRVSVAPGSAGAARSGRPSGGLRRQYDGFGKLETSGEPAIGGMKDKNPIGFSTQYTDRETGLVYYGFRYYDPSKGRFLTRDPIGESGGLNLHRFVGNDPINRVDRWGLSTLQERVLIGDVIRDALSRFPIGNGYSGGYYDPDAQQAEIDALRGVAPQSILSTPADVIRGYVVIGRKTTWNSSTNMRTLTDYRMDDYGNMSTKSWARPMGGSNQGEIGGGSRLGNALRNLPILGGLGLGSVGDVLSGLGSILTGHVGKGLGQIGYGVYDVANIAVNDVFDTVYGNTVGKLSGYSRLISQAVNGRPWKQTLAGFVRVTLVPNYGKAGGAAWGPEPTLGILDNTKDGFRTKIDGAAVIHYEASAYYLAQGQSGAPMSVHRALLSDLWSVPDREMAPVGQVYRLIGSAVLLPTLLGD